MQRKALSADEMISSLKNCFNDIPDHRSNFENVKFSIADTALSGFAMFSLKYPSVLSFTNDGRSETVEGINLRSLYQIANIPSDAQRGGVLKNFEFMDGKYLAAFDGTGVYSSDTIHCKCCMEKVCKETGKINSCGYNKEPGV